MATKAPKLINQREIEVEFGIKSKDVLRWMRAGLFPQPASVFGRTYYFDRSEVEARVYRLKPARQG